VNWITDNSIATSICMSELCAEKYELSSFMSSVCVGVARY
jgi:hypothetical protein